MKLLVVDDNYPAPGKLYADLFVHSRVQAYRDHFEEVRVIASLWKEGPDYCFDGIDVVRAGSHNRLEALARDFAPDVVLVHYATFHVIRKLIERVDLPYVVWSHGFDAVGWWRRLYELRPIGRFARYAADNMIQRFFYRRLLARAKRTKRIALVFVSRWLKRVAQADAGIWLNEAHVIPNPIDVRRFVPRKRTAADRLRWLVLRPVSKSGFDILVDALEEVRREPWFDDLQITFVGEGVGNSRFNRSFGDCPNVAIVDRSIPQNEIVDLHRSHGVFLTPTRQDSHGVSMCEAMASGMAVISCANSAIPEYVENGRTGLLSATNARSFAGALRTIHDNPELFLAIARAAPPAITEICGIDKVMDREIALIRAVGQSATREANRAIA